MKSLLTLLLIAVAVWACSDCSANPMHSVGLLADPSFHPLLYAFRVALLVYLLSGFVWLVFLILYLGSDRKLWPEFKADWFDLLRDVKASHPSAWVQAFILAIVLTAYATFEVLFWPWKIVELLMSKEAGDE